MRASYTFILISLVGVATAAKAQCPTSPTSNCVLEINGQTINGSIVAGGTPSATTAADNNQVTMTSGTITGTLEAGQSNTGTANNNSVVIDGGSIGLNVAGGRSTYNTANNNTVTINGGSITSSVAAGYSDNNNAFNNILTINGGTLNNEAFAGVGAGTNSISQGNQTFVNGGDIQQNVLGGVGGGQIISNSLTITGGHIHQNAVGGQDYPTATAGNVTGNTVSINGTGIVDGYLAGGVGPGIVTQNTATVDGGTIGNGVYGGFGQTTHPNAQVNQNQVTINSGQITGEIAGGISDGNVANNSTQINDGTITGSVYGGHSRSTGTGTASTNTVNVVGGQITGSVYGGSSVGNADGNQANITGGQISNDVTGGLSSAGAATNNTVNLTNGTIGGNFIGGSGATAVTGNAVTITDGSVQRDVYGGFGSAAGALTTDNTVTLLGGTIQGGVYGGNYGKTGNTLNLHGFQGSVAEINSFQNYSIILPDNITNGGTMVHITGGTATDMSGATVTDFSFAAGGAHYQAGDKMKLIDNATDDGSFVDKTFNQVRKGPTAAYDVLVATENNELTATILGQTVAPQSKLVGTSRIATQTLLNQGADLLSENGINQAWGPTNDCQRDGQWAFFSSFAYGNNREDNHVDVDGSSMMAGMAWRNQATCNKGFIGGIFMEAGKGDYDGHSYKGGYNTFNGDVKYYGLGLLSRYRFENRVRVEGAVRFGRLESDYHGRDYANSFSSRYDLNTNYYGLYLGTGYDINLADRWNLDLSTKYFWLHQQNKTVSIAEEKINFRSTDSHRVRTGGRLTFAPTETISTYTGAYYEYEFDGKVNAHNKTVRMKHDSLDMQGSSGVMEVGVIYQPAKLKNLALDVGVRGQAGERRGYVGYANLTWNF